MAFSAMVIRIATIACKALHMPNLVTQNTIYLFSESSYQSSYSECLLCTAQQIETIQDRPIQLAGE